MTFYRYRAIGKEGHLHKGVLEAPSTTEFKRQVQELGLSLVTYSRFFIGLQGLSSFFSRRIHPRSLREFCLHLEHLENARVPLKESLEELCQSQDSLFFKRTLLNVIQDMERGVLFSKALAKHPFVFDRVFVGLVEVGEKTGRLSFVLPQLAKHLKWKEEVHTQIFKSLRYPLIMVILFLIVVLILMTVLVPELLGFIKNFKGDLPLSTQFLLGVSSFLSYYAFGLLGGGGLILLLFSVFFKLHPTGPLWKDRLQGALPLLGPLQGKLDIGRFCHLFAVMFGGGIDILQALRTARQTLGGGRLSQPLKEVERLVYEGHSLSGAFEKGGLFPSMIIRMIKMGEQTGTLAHNLLYVKDYLDTTLKRDVENIVGLIEPLMILGIGLLMAWVVFAIFLPLYDMLTVLEY